MSSCVSAVLIHIVCINTYPLDNCDMQPQTALHNTHMIISPPTVFLTFSFKKHISAALILLPCTYLLSSFHYHMSKLTAHSTVELFLVSVLSFFEHSIFLIPVKAVFAIPILYLMSVSDLPSKVMMLPKYVKLSTCLISLAFTFSLQPGHFLLLTVKL